MTSSSAAATTDLDAVVSAAVAAYEQWSVLDPGVRADALLAAATALDEGADELITLGVAETGLTRPRLTGERTRTAVQLRLFADVIRAGEYLDVRIDAADPDFAIGPRPAVRRTLWPVGPVLNFAAGNFPLAFSVIGGDSVAALAAGCSVIVKVHPGHPQLSALTAQLVRSTLDSAGAPADLLQIVSGEQEGVELLQHSGIRAAAFTGSTRGGVFLAGLAAARDTPIPFFGELGSVNPVYLTAAALTERGDAIADAFVASVAGSAGQLCTKPGFVVAPEHEKFAERIAAAASEVGEHRLLSEKIGDAYRERRTALMHTPGMQVVAAGSVRVDDDGHTWATPTVLRMTEQDLRAAGDDALEECFGPLAVIVTVTGGSDLAALQYELFPGNLTTTLHLAGDEVSPTLAALVTAAAQTSGRVLFDGWPTGVAVTPAMQHGGPFPATTVDATSVGTAAIGRFLRGVSFQSTPDALLPPPLQDANPWHVPRTEAPAGDSAHWGRAG